MDVSKGGGSKNPDRDERIESIIFVVEGNLLLKVNGADYQLKKELRFYSTWKKMGDYKI